MEDIERQLEEIRAAAQKRVRDDFLRGAALAGPPVLTLVAGLVAFQFLDLNTQNFKYAYYAIGGGSAWLAAALWLLSFLKRRRTAGECGLRAVAFSSWLDGEADGLPFRCKLPGFVKSGAESFGFAMELELPLADKAAPLVIYRRLTLQKLTPGGALIELPPWLRKLKMGASGQAPVGVLAALGDANTLAPLFHPEAGLRILKTEGRRLRAEFLRGDPYVLTEPRDLAVLAARLARSFQEGRREGR